MKKLVILSMMMILSSASAFADDACMDAADSNMAMKMCASEDLQKADTELNAVYKKLISARKGEKEFLRRLVAAQKAWINFKEAECSLVATDMLGGTGEGLIHLSCLASKTQDRVDTLNSYLNQER